MYECALVTNATQYTILQKPCLHSVICLILYLLHDGMQALISGTAENQSKCPQGVQHWCGIAPTLFSIVLAAILRQIPSKPLIGVGLTYRMIE